MKFFKTTALSLVLATFSMAAQAFPVTWDFSWEKTYGADIFAGVGMFSYDSSAGDRVTQGGFFRTLPSELTEFSFEGFVNRNSIGGTDVLPEYFNFSPDPGIIWGLSANGIFFGQGTGVGCLFNYCGLIDDGDVNWQSVDYVTVEQRIGPTTRGGGGPTGLAEPGTLGLAGLGMLLGGLITRRRKRN